MKPRQMIRDGELYHEVPCVGCQSLGWVPILAGHECTPCWKKRKEEWRTFSST